MGIVIRDLFEELKIVGAIGTNSGDVYNISDAVIKDSEDLLDEEEILLEDTDIEEFDSSEEEYLLSEGVEYEEGDELEGFVTREEFNRLYLMIDRLREKVDSLYKDLNRKVVATNDPVVEEAVEDMEPSKLTPAMISTAPRNKESWRDYVVLGDQADSIWDNMKDAAFDALDKSDPLNRHHPVPSSLIASPRNAAPKSTNGRGAGRLSDADFDFTSNTSEVNASPPKGLNRNG